MEIVSCITGIFIGAVTYMLVALFLEIRREKAEVYGQLRVEVGQLRFYCERLERMLANKADKPVKRKK